MPRKISESTIAGCDTNHLQWQFQVAATATVDGHKCPFLVADKQFVMLKFANKMTLRDMLLFRYFNVYNLLLMIQLTIDYFIRCRRRQ